MRPKSNPYSRCHFATLAAAILAFHVVDAHSQAVPPVISRIFSTTNGLALSWSGESTNAAYTVQFRASLTSGAWQNASTRYRWPSPFPQWSDAPMTVRAPRFYRVIADTAPPAERGRLLTHSTVGQLSTNQVRTVMLDLGASGFVSPRL